MERIQRQTSTPLHTSCVSYFSYKDIIQFLSHVMLRSLMYRVFKKELYNVIPNVAVWRVLRKRLHLKAYKLSIVHLGNTSHTAIFGIPL
jgi:hypothetical protein